MAKEIDFDTVLLTIGELGRFQKLCYGCICAFIIIGTVPGFVAIVFQSYIPDYRCYVPFCDNTTQVNSNFDSKFVNFSVPLQQNGVRSSCERFWRYNMTSHQCRAADFDRNISVSCTRFVYDTSVFESSFVTQWNLTCKYQSLVQLPNTLYFSGVLIGSILFGFISDRFGRKSALLLSVVVLLFASGAACALYSSFVAICALRVLLGMSSCGFFQTALVISVELVGKQWRVPFGTIINYFTTLGSLTGVGLGYLVRDWVQLQWITTAPLVLMIPVYCVLPESVRWLLTQGRRSDALKVIARIARWNGRSVPSLDDSSQGCQTSDELCNQQVVFDNDKEEDEEDCDDDDNVQLIPSTHTETAGSIIDCLHVPSLRRRLVYTLLGWFSANIAFYGLVINMQNIHGDFFINLLITSLAEIPGYTLCWVLMDRVGRRNTFVSSTLLGGVAIVAAGLIPNNMAVANIVLLVLGKCGSCTSFALVYIYTTELFPTPARNTAVGLCSTCGRVAAILTPQIANLAVYGESIPLLVIGGVSVISGLFTALLPETKGKPLPETLQEAIDIDKSRPCSSTSSVTDVTSEVNSSEHSTILSS